MDHTLAIFTTQPSWHGRYFPRRPLTPSLPRSHRCDKSPAAARPIVARLRLTDEATSGGSARIPAVVWYASAIERKSGRARDVLDFFCWLPCDARKCGWRQRSVRHQNNMRAPGRRSQAASLDQRSGPEASYSTSDAQFQTSPLSVVLRRLVTGEKG